MAMEWESSISDFCCIDEVRDFNSLWNCADETPSTLALNSWKQQLQKQQLCADNDWAAGAWVLQHSVLFGGVWRAGQSAPTPTSTPHRDGW
jgi:hypothetical protein